MSSEAGKRLALSLRRAVSNLPESYGGFGLVRRHEVDDALVLVLQRWLDEDIAAVEAEAVAARNAEIREAVRGLDDLTGHMIGKYHYAYVQVLFGLDHP